jgi:hypothetical protein
VRSLPDEAELEALRASKKQKQEERKLEIIQERQERAHNAELARLEQATDCWTGSPTILKRGVISNSAP